MTAIINGRRKPILFAKVVKRDGWVCWICDNPIDPDLPRDHDEAGTLDHVTPRALGGSNAQSNLRLAHRCCNNWRACPEVVAA